MKNILFATSEAVPFIKTGGLADVAGALPKCFDKNEYDVRVVLPKYAIFCVIISVLNLCAVIPDALISKELKIDIFTFLP